MNLTASLQSRPGRRLTRTDAVHGLVTALAAGMVGRLGLSEWVRPEMILLIVPVVVAAALVLRHPKWCVVGVIATSVFGTYRSGGNVGAFTLRPADVFVALLAGWAVHLRVREGRKPTSRVGQLQLGLLMGVLGMSLLTTVGDPAGVLEPFASLLRLVLTFALAWLVPYAVREREDRMFLLRATAVLVTAELVKAVFFSAGAGGRLTGSNGPNVEGLLAVVLLVMVLNLPLLRRNIRIVMGLLAALALVEARSIGSVTALVIVLGAYGIRAASHSPRASALIKPARIIMLVVGGFLLVASLRPDDVPRGSGFDGSSTALRVTFGYAGLTVFRDHPIMGVGWQRSPTAITSEAVVAKVRERFSRVRTDLLRPGDSDITLHNAYVQILAESGLVGFGILATGLMVGRRRIRALIAGAGTDAEVARTLMVSLVVILIWWNDSTLFGAQPEVVLFAFFLGLLASIGLEAQRGEPSPPSTSAGEPTVLAAGTAPERA